ncbi:MAG: phosphatidate cytidylyltransferase [Candidatus Obscuribacterales bacterium]|nr:phosphatidate cytidylyltransferase [Candidatus Obscuribacterales bacterium]
MSKRVIYGFALFLIAIGALAAGGVIWAVTLGLACIIAGNEFVAMTQAKGMKPSPRIVRNMIFAFFALAAFPSIPGINLPPTFSIEHFPILLTVGVCASFFRLLFRGENPPATIADIATTILGFIYVGWMPSHLVLLRNLVPPGMSVQTNPLQQPGLAYVWASLFIIWATDVFAYYAGKKFGKNLLYPQVSPKKTVEGAIGGFLASIFWAVVVVYCADHYIFPDHPFRNKLWQAPLMGALVSIAAQLGDLCESLLKRDAGIKDSGNLIPGHGGMLDRGDGLLFAGAISYYWVCVVVLGIL